MPGRSRWPLSSTHDTLAMLRMISFPWHQNAFGGVSSGGGGGILWDIQHVLGPKAIPRLLELLELLIHIMYHTFFRIINICHYILYIIKNSIRYPHERFMKRWRFIPIISPSKITILLNIPRNISESFYLMCHASPMVLVQSQCKFLGPGCQSHRNPIEPWPKTSGLSVAELQEGVIRLCSIKSWQGISRVSLWVKPGHVLCRLSLIYPLTNIAMV